MPGPHDETSTQASRLSALADPLRRRIYDYVAAQSTPVRRDEAAASVGISRTLAAYHLDRLADAGLLATSYARPEGHTGPRAGRPAKQYEPADSEVSITVPPRTYDLLARLLADALATDHTGHVTSALLAAAEREGRTTTRADTDLLPALRTRAYEPEVAATNEIELRNCPFHRIAQAQTTLICGLNHALLRGILAGLGDNPSRAALTPRAGRCCVVIHPHGTDHSTDARLP